MLTLEKYNYLHTKLSPSSRGEISALVAPANSVSNSSTVGKLDFKVSGCASASQKFGSKSNARNSTLSWNYFGVQVIGYIFAESGHAPMV